MEQIIRTSRSSKELNRKFNTKHRPKGLYILKKKQDRSLLQATPTNKKEIKIKNTIIRSHSNYLIYLTNLSKQTIQSNKLIHLTKPSKPTSSSKKSLHCGGVSGFFVFLG